jgi:hypothetical protein
MSKPTVEFKSCFTVGAMREMMVRPQNWYGSVKYHRAILMPAIEAGFMIEQRAADPRIWKNGRRYQLTEAGIAYMRALQ